MRASSNVALRLAIGLISFLGAPIPDAFAQAPVPLLSPSSLTFAAQTVGTTSASQPITLTNTGTATLTITGVVLSGSFGGDFAQTTKCGTSLAPNASCAINVSFRPTGTEIRTGSLLVIDNAQGSPQVVALTGTGVGSCSNISDCAYQVLNQRVSANQSNFFVYQDADSGFNHGFPSGLFGTIALSTVVINSGCLDSFTSSTGCSTDSTSLDGTRGTVFSISFPSLSGTDFVGLNFQDPENYDGQTIIGNGYNLTPATGPAVRCSLAG